MEALIFVKMFIFGKHLDNTMIDALEEWDIILVGSFLQMVLENYST